MCLARDTTVSYSLYLNLRQKKKVVHLYKYATQRYLNVVSEDLKNLSILLYVWLIFELTLSITHFSISTSVIIPSYFENISCSCFH
jgi:hypothetical protein